MRLWSLHPRYLDAAGLVALWREGLLAQAVLRGHTRGYTSHPQLQRFRECERPVAQIATYLRAVRAEAVQRGYNFDVTRIARVKSCALLLPVTRGQLDYEWEHLLRKLSVRNPTLHAKLSNQRRPAAHPMFRVTAGGVSDWERISPASLR